LNITGERNDPLGKRIPIFKMLFLILLGTKREFVKTGINIRTFDALFEDEDERMKMWMKIFLT
jgi:hypothetical protein